MEDEVIICSKALFYCDDQYISSYLRRTLYIEAYFERSQFKSLTKIPQLVKTRLSLEALVFGCSVKS